VRKEWVVEVNGRDSLFSHNSIGGESGPWSWSQEDATITDRTRTYGVKKVGESLATRINAALEGGLPQRIDYCPEDLEDAG
jgi:hypothetical protein